jgi:integrase
VLARGGRFRSPQPRRLRSAGTVPGSSRTGCVLGPAWTDYDTVFTSEVGGPLDGSNILQRYFYPLLEGAGLPRVRFHDLRHTAATLMLSRGLPPKIVSEISVTARSRSRPTLTCT